MKYIPISIEDFEEILEGKPVARLIYQQARKGDVLGFEMIDNNGFPTGRKLKATALKSFAMGCGTWAVTVLLDCEL